MTTTISTRKATGVWTLLCVIAMVLAGAFTIVATTPRVALASDVEDPGTSPSQGGGKTRDDWQNLTWRNIWYDSDTPENPPQGTTEASNFAFWSNLIRSRYGLSSLNPDATWDQRTHQAIQEALDRSVNAALASGTDPAYAAQARIVGVHFLTASNGDYPVGVYGSMWKRAFNGDPVYAGSLRGAYNSGNSPEVPQTSHDGSRMWDDATTANVWNADRDQFVAGTSDDTIYRYQFVAVTRGIEVAPPHKKADAAVAYVEQPTTYHVSSKVITPPPRLSFSDDLDTVYDPASATFKVTRDGTDVTGDFELSSNGQHVTIASKAGASLRYGDYDCAITVRLTSNTIADHELVTDPSDEHYGYFKIHNKAQVNGMTTEDAPVFTPGFYLEVQKDSYDQDNVPADFDETRYGDATYTLYTDDGGKPSSTVAKTLEGLDATFDTSTATGSDSRKYFGPGTYWLVETGAPQGFDVDPTPIEITFSGDSGQVEHSTTSHDVRLVNAGDGLKVEVRQRNHPIMGGVKVQKVDSDLYRLRMGTAPDDGDDTDASDYDPTVPEGDASLAGASFEVYNVSGSDVVIHGKRVKSTTVAAVRAAKRTGDFDRIADAKVTDIGDDGRIVTDAKGRGQSATNALVWGSYAIVETDAPEGYLNDSVVRTFDVREEGVLVDLTQIG